MNVTPLAIPDVLLIEPRLHRDSRGHFLETFSAARYHEAGIPGSFVQDNLSRSHRGVLRGLHFQEPSAQAKLVWAAAGEVFDVAVDVRVGSPTFGRWVGCTLSSETGRQLYIPEGFAHGFVTLSETAVFAYKCTAYYDPAAERCVRWNDPDIGIRWPIGAPVVSEKDRRGPLLRELAPEVLPRYQAAASREPVGA